MGKINSSSQGNAGDVIINADSFVSLDGSGSGVISQVEEGGSGKGGNILINTDQILVTNEAQLRSSNFGQGDAGDVTINANSSVSFDGGNIFSTVEAAGIGKSGNILINTAQISVTNGAELRSSNFGQGDAGDVTINANSSVSFDRGNVFSTVGSEMNKDAEGNAGVISITTGFLEVTNGAELRSSNFGQGDAGDVTINADSSVSFDGLSGVISGVISQVERDGKGKGGKILINTDQLSVTNEAQLRSSNFGEGDAGDITINANSSVSFDGGDAFSTVEENGIGKSGNILINTNQLSVKNGGELRASTFGLGEGGDVTINARDSVSFEGKGSGAFTQIERDGEGKGGDIKLTTDFLEVLNGATLTTSNFGLGEAGDVIVNTREILINNQGTLRTSVEEEVDGKGGDIIINTDSFSILGNASLLAQTQGQGNAGNININASKFILFDAQNQCGDICGVLSEVGKTGVGEGGEIKIRTGSLSLNNGARLSAQTLGKGQGGSLDIQTGSLSLINNSLITAQTSGQGDAGNIEVRDVESVSITNSIISSQSNSASKAGNLTVNAGEMTIIDGAAVTVSSPQGQAGNLNINAQNLSLNQGSITAVTGQEGIDGANIFLSVGDSLFLANQSLISANANEDANGGNVDIDARFVITSFPAIPNGSDINANAQRGDGGRITLTAEGVFGTEFREAQTPLNDITATSESGDAGIVVINSPNVDPSRGITELAQPVDPNDEIVRACTPTEAGDLGEFTVTGRGGLPASPTDALSRDTVLEDLGTLAPSPETSDQKGTPESSVPPSSPLVEAEGWIVAKNGDIIFISKAASASSQSDWQSSLNCSTADSN